MIPTWAKGGQAAPDAFQLAPAPGHKPHRLAGAFEDSRLGTWQRLAAWLPRSCSGCRPRGQGELSPPQPIACVPYGSWP